jgi:hypothetical protein
MKEKKIVKTISHTAVRYILRENGIELRHSKKTILGKSRDPEYDLKKSVLRN